MRAASDRTTVVTKTRPPQVRAVFSTCLHCHHPLGRNQVIEHFPVGRKFAFDGAKGRLWVVCTRCRRWNLTPLEERWEAIEECERLYRGTRLRAATDNIGLARVGDGMEIVRIGRPQTPEFAAWRYARDFGRRWMTRGLPLAAGAGVLQGLNPTLTGTVPGPVSLAIVAGLATTFVVTQWRVARARIALPSGRVATISGPRLRCVRLEPQPGGWSVSAGDRYTPVPLSGPDAIPALRALMTARNYAGAPQDEVERAIQVLADAGDPERFISRLARASQRTGIRNFPPEIAMALEMALHEGTERRALEGELGLLEHEWELAEEIAAIADDMFLPDAVREKHRRLAEGRP